MGRIVLWANCLSSLKIYLLKPIFEGESFGKKLGLEEVIRMGPPVKGLVPLKKRCHRVLSHPTSSTFHTEKDYVRTQQESSCHVQARKSQHHDPTSLQNY